MVAYYVLYSHCDLSILPWVYDPWDMIYIGRIPQFNLLMCFGFEWFYKVVRSVRGIYVHFYYLAYLGTRRIFLS